jgi:hypothetical protein
MSSVFTLVSQVLRDPVAVVDRNGTPDALARSAPALLGIAVVCAAIFGAVVGSSRGSLQVAYAAIKMPLLLWIPVMLALPASYALWRACELDVAWNRVVASGLVAMARTAILAAAAGPVLWLFYSVQPGYHVSVLALAAALVAVGLPGMTVVAHAMPAGGRRRGLAKLGSLVVLGLCVAQTGWVLRPFVSRPAGEVAFLRPIEEDIFSSLSATSRSATGDYSKDWEPERKGMTRGLFEDVSQEAP